MLEKNEALRIELTHLRENLIDAIHQGRVSAATNNLSIYIELINAFIDSLKPSPSQESGSRPVVSGEVMKGAWSEIEWIQSDYRDITGSAFRSGQSLIIKEVVALPFEVAVHSLRKRDLYVFSGMVQWFPHFYVLINTIPDAQDQAFVRDRCVRYLSELIEIVAVSEAENATSPKEVKGVGEFIVKALSSFNQILFRTLKSRNSHDFARYVNTLKRLLSGYRLTFSLEGVLALQESLSETEDQQVDEEDVSDLGDLALVHLSVYSRLALFKELILFGLQAWIAKGYNTGELPDAANWYRLFDHPTSLQLEWEKAEESTKEDVDTELGWDMFDAEQIHDTLAPIATAHWSTIDQFALRLFCLKSLQVLASDSHQQLKPTTRLSQLAKGTSSTIQVILDEIERDGQRWALLVGEPAIKQMGRFREILGEAVDLQDKKDDLQLRSAQVDPSYVAEYKAGLIEERGKTSVLRKLLKDAGSYKVIDEPIGSTYFGMSHLERKDIFVRDYFGQDVLRFVREAGREAGRAIAKGEDQIILTELLPAIRSIELDKATEPKLADIVESEVRALLNKKGNPCIISFGGWEARRLLMQAGVNLYTDADVVGYFGERRTPVYTLYYLNLNEFVIVDLSQIGVLKQFKPVPEPGAVEIDQGLYFSARFVDPEYAHTLVANAEKRGQPSPGQGASADEKVQDLQKYVHLRIAEQVRFEVSDREVAVHLKLRRFNRDS